jgi:hypothetical protein
MFDEGADCCICLETFKASDEVIVLPCSNRHVYHEACIKDYLDSQTKKKQCALCRETIDWDEFKEDPDFDSEAN